MNWIVPTSFNRSVTLYPTAVIMELHFRQDLNLDGACYIITSLQDHVLPHLGLNTDPVTLHV